MKIYVKKLAYVKTKIYICHMLVIKMPDKVYLQTIGSIEDYLLSIGFREKDYNKNHICMTNDKFDLYLPLFYVGYTIIYKVIGEEMVDYYLNHSLQPKKIISRFKRYIKKHEASF